MRIKIVNLLKDLQHVYQRYFYLIPTVCWQSDGANFGIWLCWLHLGIYVYKEKKNKYGMNDH